MEECIGRWLYLTEVVFHHLFEKLCASQIGSCPSSFGQKPLGSSKGETTMTPYWSECHGPRAATPRIQLKFTRLPRLFWPFIGTPVSLHVKKHQTTLEAWSWKSSHFNAFFGMLGWNHHSYIPKKTVFFGTHPGVSSFSWNKCHDFPGFDCDSMDLLQSSLRYQGPTPSEWSGYSWNININIAPSSRVVKWLVWFLQSDPWLVPSTVRRADIFYRWMRKRGRRYAQVFSGGVCRWRAHAWRRRWKLALAPEMAKNLAEAFTLLVARDGVSPISLIHHCVSSTSATVAATTGL